jgi:hypothetical protein
MALKLYTEKGVGGGGAICHDLAFHKPFSTFHRRFIPNTNWVIP